MDLKIFCAPVNHSILDGYPQNSFFKNITVYQGQLPDVKSANIALIGIGARLEEKSSNTVNASDEVRKKIYALKKGTGSYNIVDLGNLYDGVDEQDTISRLREVCKYLIENSTLPIIIGGHHHFDYGQFQSYQDMDKMVSFLNIDAQLDMTGGDGSLSKDNHIHKLLIHEPNYLFNYSHLGYQSYLIDNDSINTLEKLYFEAYRVGSLRSNIPDMEPVIRNADLVSFDMCAIKSSDAPGVNNAQPFGLTGEEACQICWYAGINEKLSSIGFYEYNPELDDSNKKTASVLATMVWYFIEGYYHRKQEASFKSNDYLKYVVSMHSEPETLIFYKSKLSEKWWLEVPYPKGKKQYSRNCIVPCSYGDYEAATQGDLPERYITTLAKLI